MSLRASKLFALTALALLVPLAAQAQTVKTQLTFGTQIMLGIAANPATNQIYAVASSGTGISDTLAVIDGSTDTVTDNITVPVGASLPAVNILTNRVYVATCDFYVYPTPCTVTVVNGYSGSVVTSIPVTTTDGNGLTGIAVDPVTANVYVANGSDNVIDIISGFTNKVVGSISLGGVSPYGIVFNPINRLLYVTLGSSQIDIVNPVKKTIVGTSAPVGTSIYNAAANWVTGDVFVTDTQYANPTASILSAKGALLAQVPTDAMPWGVDVDPITNLAFVANSAYATVLAINGHTFTATAASPLYNVPAQYVSVNFVTEKAYVAGQSTVSVLTEK